jgi:hypothetical protein
MGTEDPLLSRVASRVAAAWPAWLRLDMTLFLLVLLVFLLTRLIGLVRFPIYFFTDEAVQTVLAADLVHNGYHDKVGRLLPAYFQNGRTYNLSASVYLQVFTYKLFGFSIFWTRATSALIALSGTAAVGLVLRDVFRLRFWWLGALLLSATPTWFLHSRTAFETVLAVSFYAWALYFYLLYRCKHPAFLYPAVIFVALAFYAYAGSQLAVIATAAVFALSDARYHLAHRRTVLIAIGIIVVTILPYVRFRLTQPDEVYLHLRTLGSYWLDDNLSVRQKMHTFVSEYAYGLSPKYWYGADNTRDLVRHQMKGWGYIWLPTLPFAAIGLGLSLWKVRMAEYRALLLATLAAPLGGAVVAVGITRVLLFIVPAALLTAIGLEATLGLIARRVRYEAVAIAAFVALSFVNVAMLRSALVDGPTWYTNYGLYGMQWGGRQVADAVRADLAESPSTRVLISPNWANGEIVIFQFLLSDEQARVALEGLGPYREGKLKLSDDLVFVLTPEEYAAAIQDPSLTDIRVEKVIRYPDGNDGFYFVRVTASPDAAAIAQRERDERRKPVTEDTQINGETVSITHSKFDAGSLAAMFDNDTFTLARTLDADPATYDLVFPTPHNFTGLRLSMGSHVYTLTVNVFTDPNGPVAATYTQEFPNPGPDPTVELPFTDPPPGIRRVSIQIKDLRRGTDGHIHVREMKLLP